MGWMKDETGLEKTQANYVPLTPLSHLMRAARVFPTREALIDGPFRATYAQLHARVSRLASALAARGIAPGDVVATVLPNTHPHVEAHFGVPACGAVLNAINIRLDVATVSYIFDHGEAKMVLADTQFLGLGRRRDRSDGGARPHRHRSPRSRRRPPRQRAATRPMRSCSPKATRLRLGSCRRTNGKASRSTTRPGTTGRPKGVVYHHRGAYLITHGHADLVAHGALPDLPDHRAAVSLQQLVPCLDHASRRRNDVCCRDITAKAIYDAIADEDVTHFGGAPIVLNMLVHAKPADRRDFDQTVQVFTAGAPPAAATLAAIETMGFHVTQVYGLTEVYWSGHRMHVAGPHLG